MSVCGVPTKNGKSSAVINTGSFFPPFFHWYSGKAGDWGSSLCWENDVTAWPAAPDRCRIMDISSDQQSNHEQFRTESCYKHINCLNDAFVEDGIPQG